MQHHQPDVNNRGNIQEFTVAPDVERLKAAFPDMSCISHAEFNHLLLRGMIRIIQTREINIAEHDLRYFKVLAEVQNENEPPGYW
jgi:hypothetical protein